VLVLTPGAPFAAEQVPQLYSVPYEPHATDVVNPWLTGWLLHRKKSGKQLPHAYPVKTLLLS
jgi:hypothetical protein